MGFIDAGATNVEPASIAAIISSASLISGISGRRRKAFEGGRENGLGFGGAGNRLVEFGQRQRGAQFEAARALLLRDGNGGQESLFRGRGVGGVALQQDFASRAMQFRFERAIAQAVGRRQRFVEDGYGSAWIARLGFGPRQRDLQEPVENQDVLCAQQLDAAAHAVEPAAQSRRLRRSPTHRETCRTRGTCADRARARGRASSQAFAATRASVAAHQFEHGREHSSEARACRHA